MAEDYCTAAEAATALGINDAADNVRLQICVTAASRQIEGFVGRRFWQDSTVQTREFYADDSRNVDLLDQPGSEPKVEISTTTGLIVKVDSGCDGTFATTLTIDTHFALLPRNAADDSRPYSALYVVGGSNYFPVISNGRPGVQITARFGWATTPTEVKQATILQAELLFKSQDAPLGAAELGQSGGVLFQRAAIHPVAKALLVGAGLQRPLVG